MSNSTNIPGPLTLSRTDAAQLLGISTISLDRLTKRGLLRPCRALRRPIYAIGELQRFLKDTTKEDYR